eukprot:437968_1
MAQNKLLNFLNQYSDQLKLRTNNKITDTYNKINEEMDYNDFMILKEFGLRDGLLEECGLKKLLVERIIGVLKTQIQDCVIYREYNVNAINEQKSVEREQKQSQVLVENDNNEQKDIDENDDTSAIVIDNGSHMTRAGFGGDDMPRVVFRSVVGRPQMTRSMGYKDVYCGDEAVSKYGLMRNEPVDLGIVNNWDDMEKLWHYTFYDELKVAPDQHSVLLTEPAVRNKTNREKATQIMFDTFCVQSYFAAASSILSLYAAGRTDGIVIDSGYQKTDIVPVSEGYSVPHAVFRLDIGGKHIEDQLKIDLRERGCTFYRGKPDISGLRENLCYVAMDYEEELNKAQASSELEQNFELPDGTIMTVGTERFTPTEILFQPYKMDIENGVHECLYKAINKCDRAISKDLYGNILLVGGNTMFDGFAERIKKEISNLAPDSMTIKVIAPPERKYSPWIGGAIVANQTEMTELWITKEEYDESGSSIVHRKCDL